MLYTSLSLGSITNIKSYSLSCLYNFFFFTDRICRTDTNAMDKRTRAKAVNCHQVINAVIGQAISNIMYSHVRLLISDPQPLRLVVTQGR